MENHEYYLWGAGIYGARIIDYMKNDLAFKAVIDNDPKKQGSVFHGMPVVSYEAARDNLPNAKIIIALNVPTEIRELLLADGFVERKEFFTVHDFIPWFYWANKNSIVVKSIDVAATTKCNMKCDGCQTFMPFAVNSKHISAESILNDVELLFTHADAIMNLNFCTGESLLNKDLPEICYQIYKKYTGRYGWLLVQTNGTIIPDDAVLRRVSKSKALFGISNYPENKKTTEKLVAKLSEFNIKWYFNRAGGKREIWYDWGDPRVVKENNMENLRKLYARCWKPGMALVDGWLYICAAQAWSHLIVNAGTLEPGDAFDLRQLKNDETRNNLYKIISRQPPKKGYISHCTRCNSVMTPFIKEPGAFD